MRLSVRQVTARKRMITCSLGAFLRGFVRNYAAARWMPPRCCRDWSSPFPTAAYPNDFVSDRGTPFPSNRDRGKRNLIIGAGVVLALLLLVYEIYRGSEANVEKAPSANVESRAAAEESPDTRSFEPPGELMADRADVRATADRPGTAEPKHDVQPSAAPTASSPVLSAAPQPAQPPAASKPADAPVREAPRPQSASTAAAPEPGEGPGGSCA